MNCCGVHGVTLLKSHKSVLYICSKENGESGRTIEEMEEQCQETSVGTRRD